MAQFKTRYVGELYRPQTTAGDVIEKTFQGVGAAIQGIAQQKQKAINDTVERYGLNQPIKTNIPTGLNDHFVGPAQEMLNQLQKTAAEAKLNPSANNLDAYTRAKTEYEDLLKVATATSSVNNQTNVNIRTGNVEGLATTQDEALKLYEEYQAKFKGNVTVDEAGKVLIGGVYWRETEVADINNVFVPPIISKATKYAPDALARQIVSDIGNKANEYAKTESYRGNVYTVGIDENKLAQRVLQDVTALDTDAEYNKSISYYNFSKGLGSDVSFRTEHETAALTNFDPNANDATTTDGKRYAEIKNIDASGNVTWAVEDKDIPDGISERDKIIKWREAKAKYAKELYTSVKEEMPITDMTERLTAVKRETARQETEVKRKEAEAKKEALESKLSEAPALAEVEGVYVLPAVGKEIADTGTVTEVTISNDGTIIAYRIQPPKSESSVVSTPGTQTAQSIEYVGSQMQSDVIAALNSMEKISLARYKVRQYSGLADEAERNKIISNPGVSGKVEFKDGGKLKVNNPTGKWADIK